MLLLKPVLPTTLQYFSTKEAVLKAKSPVNSLLIISATLDEDNTVRLAFLQLIDKIDINKKRINFLNMTSYFEILKIALLADNVSFCFLIKLSVKLNQ